MTKRVLGIIGGSGLYDLPGLEHARWHDVSTPFGNTSDHLLVGSLGGLDLVFLPRHGRGHRLSPSHLNYRANIDALKRVGVTDIISVSAVGSLRETLDVGSFVLVDQYVDLTRQRPSSFFGEGIVAHVSMAHPVCEVLGAQILAAGQKIGLPIHQGGTYVCIEGPQFSTLAESQLYRAQGFDVIGMTNMPEARLAREAEIPYATLAMITDFDCWHEVHGQVQVADIARVMQDNAHRARDLIAVLPEIMGPERAPNPIDRVLDDAIITALPQIAPAAMHRLDAILKRYLDRVEV